MLAGGATEEHQAARAAHTQAEFSTPAAQLSSPPALDKTCAAFGLSDLGRDILVLCAGLELDASLAAVCAAADGDSHKRYPRSAWLSRPFANRTGAHFAFVGMRRWRLIEVGPGETLTSSPLRIDERMLHFLMGVSHLDQRLMPLLEIVSPQELPASQAAAAERLARQWSALETGGASPLFHLVGGDAPARRTLAAAACAAVEMRLHAVQGRRPAGVWRRGRPLRAALGTRSESHFQHPRDRSGRILRERRAQRTRAVCRSGRRNPGRQRLPADGCSGAADGAGGNGQPDGGRTASGVAAIPGASGRAAQRPGRSGGDALSPGLGGDPQLANQSKARAAPGRATSGPWTRSCGRCRATSPRSSTSWPSGSSPRRLGAIWSCRPSRWPCCTASPRTCARRSRVYEEWGFERQGQRGLGISALFCGPSGTGKTMAAEVLAQELALDLFRIDLSAVVNKYIGETEKNLRRVFDAAEESGAILLFDEADALFGKRSEVKDAHDRYANIEVSYLLQRVESYRGLALLTTNMRPSIDAAFLHRIRFVVQFPFPDAASRLEIWRRVFPPGVPTEGLVLDHLARLNLSGGNIRNVALGAAFLAADADEPVRMRHLLLAAQGRVRQARKAALRSRDWRLVMRRLQPVSLELHIDELVLHGFAPGSDSR